MKRYLYFFLITILFSGCSNFFLNPLNKGEKLFKQEKYEEAKGEFIKAMKDKDSQYKAKIYLGRIYAIQGDVKKAIEILEEARDSALNAPDAYFYLGVVYQLDSRYRDAEKALDKLSNLPGYGKGWSIAPVMPPAGVGAGEPLKPGRRDFLIKVLKGKAFK